MSYSFIQSTEQSSDEVAWRNGRNGHREVDIIVKREISIYCV